MRLDFTEPVDDALALSQALRILVGCPSPPRTRTRRCSTSVTAPRCSRCGWSRPSSPTAAAPRSSASRRARSSGTATRLPRSHTSERTGSRSVSGA
ncbi:hypothetical protein [Rhodococcus parequi]|uniref:hypothetical protein n=1 Tax=Rhodococcus parequi TaxID=3137122 RepID=UPI003B3A3DF7